MTPEEIAAAKAAQLAGGEAAGDQDQDYDQDQDQDKDDGSQQDQDHDGGDDQGDDDPKALELEKLRKENEELKARAEKDRMRAKKSYAKADEVKKTYVSKEDVEKMRAEREEKVSLTSKFPDATAIMTDIEKLKSERGLSYTEAYALVKGKQMLDPGYRAQASAGRGSLHGTLQDVKLDDPIFSQGPEIAKDYTKK